MRKGFFLLREPDILTLEETHNPSGKRKEHDLAEM